MDFLEKYKINFFEFVFFIVVAIVFLCLLISKIENTQVIDTKTYYNTKNIKNQTNNTEIKIYKHE